VHSPHITLHTLYIIHLLTYFQVLLSHNPPFISSFPSKTLKNIKVEISEGLDREALTRSVLIQITHYIST